MPLELEGHKTAGRLNPNDIKFRLDWLNGFLVYGIGTIDLQLLLSIFIMHVTYICSQLEVRDHKCGI